MNHKKCPRPISAAHHEAAHAVIARRLGASIDRIFLDGDGGQCDFITPLGWSVRDDALVLLAGPIASMRILKRSGFAVIGCSQDYTIARGLFDERSEFGEAMDAARELVRKHWEEIKELARGLLESDDLMITVAEM
ncbi:hypothetical protein THIX_70178 [Thiomonas sp. X19]|uniref:hypothetical protein n=1 Tax=Thiomonas sp. X19 TaxID=1050370 RepID=UPI000B6AE073|nr:hypothetical protein [Thiomonas sp. X19]MDE2129137.1 hypothetical protein [Betaproteobacteria bacterium]SCC95149.1 hypothetical protein THIX_70178 [Thiomonas sp. X19]